jgi:hypothetical protein
MKERKIVMVGKKTTFAEAEAEELFQWLNVPFEEKWKILEVIRETFYKFHGLSFPRKVKRVINITKG